MAMKNILAQFNIINEAKRHGIPLWQSPQFLFVSMGFIIMISTVFSYLMGLRYIGDPITSVLLILGLASIQLVVAFVITQSFERLIEANRLKSEFVSVVSHQLRSPLTNLKWALDFLVEEGKDSRSTKEESYLQILIDNTTRMRDLVNDLLIVSRIEQGRLPLHKQEFLFQELVKDVLDGFRPFIRASNIVVKMEGKEDIPAVFSDSGRIRQIIANFFDNAIRYTKKEMPGGEEKIIIARYYETTGNSIRFEVQDNGIGIPSGDQKFIFQKFFRSRNASRHQTEGSGLGLNIARAIIEKAGGEIGFESEENKGSTFWFTLPIA